MQVTRSLLLLVALMCASAIVANALYTKKDDVIQADSTNFKELVVDSPRHSIIEFYAPWCGHCKTLAPEYKKAATALKGFVNVVAIDADAESGKALAQKFGIKGFPTLFFWNAETRKHEDYQGARQAAAITKYALDKLPTKLIQTVTAKSLDKFVSEKGAKALLFTSKKESSAMYKALSLEFKDRITLGEIRKESASDEILAKYNVEKFPTLVVFKDDEEHTVEPYTGKLDIAAVGEFLSLHAAPPKVSSKKSSKDKEETPKPEVPVTLGELKKPSDFKEQCTDFGSGLCIIGFLPQEADDADAHKRALETMQSLVDLHLADKKAAKSRGGFRFMHVNGVEQSKFRDLFGLSADLPTMAVYSPSKNRYAPYFGVFSAESVREFLERILSGTRRTVPLDSDPAAALTA